MPRSWSREPHKCAFQIEAAFPQGGFSVNLGKQEGAAVRLAIAIALNPPFIGFGVCLDCGGAPEAAGNAAREVAPEQGGRGPAAETIEASENPGSSGLR